jgi:hypothetical protein
MRGRYFVPLTAEHREGAGVAAGELVDVDIDLDTEVRDLPVARRLGSSVEKDSAARVFDQQSYTNRKEWAPWIEETKKPETRSTRLERTIAALKEGRRTHSVSGAGYRDLS